MSDIPPPSVPLYAADAPPRARPSSYPAPFAKVMEKREKRPLGDRFGLKNFGVNLTRLQPGGQSALFHKHSRQDEFIYVLKGEPVLILESGEYPLRAGMCIGFPAGGSAHRLINPSTQDAVFLEVGDRTIGDDVVYPEDDIAATLGANGQWHYRHKDGTPY